MLNGPKIQENLDKLILRWREHKYVIAADIEKMFRQIWINKDQQNYQRIVWRENSNHPIQNFVLKTVTYGTKAASFLSIRTLNKLAEDEGENYPVAAKILKQDFYVDDLLTGSDTKADVINAFHELSGLMAKGGFLLRKWTSNDSTILAEIPKEIRSNGTINIKLNDIIKTLGILYDPRDDKFQFNTQHLQLSTSKISTKRSLLSDSSKIFDPMGWLSPIVISSKLLMQDVWISGIGWDDKLPTEIDKRWSKYKDELKSIDSIVIPRWVNTIKSKNVEFHGFADASEKALAAAVYYRVIGEKVETTLIMAKTKVAPISNKITIPRLELNATLLLVKLLNHIRQSTQYANAETYCWTDSTIALSWIKGNINNYKPWVSNRVSTIRKLLPQAVWRHVPSEENPADVASRGINPGRLHNFELWWSGPTFLRSNKAKWPKDIVAETKDELKQSLISNVGIMEYPFLQLFSRISEYRKLIRVIAYTLRFIDKCKKLKIPRILEISAVEFKKANEIAIKMMQMDEFSEEITRLQTGQQLNKGSKLLSLNPFLDDKNILRVGGRIEKSLVPYDQRHPIILPKSGLLTILIIKDAHRLTLHGGTTLVVAFLRQRYWITNVRSAIRYIIHKCVTCCRYSKNNNHQLMAPLPRERVTASMPFEIAGVDYAGPILIKTSKGRSKQTFKGYIAIFVCFTTKACHIEVVSDQTTEAFIAAYRRFSSRRGVSTHIYSDNGTTFVGANRKINGLFNKLLQAQLIEESAYQGTNWHFIPPGTPHFGGLWEAGVKSAKYHLKRVIGDTKLTFEELATLCSQIEACMNSRPLSIISSESTTSLILTPAHFLIGRSLLAVPEDNYGEIKQNRLSRWELLQQLKQHFWKHWHTDYLNSLQQRYKWKQLKPNIATGQIVLIKNKDGYPSTWPMGKVVEVHPGDDGNIRVISVKHKNGITKHSIKNLCPLPIEEDNYGYSTPPAQPNEELKASEKNVISTRRVTRSMKAFHCGLSADLNNTIRTTKNRPPAEGKAKPMRLVAIIKAILFVIILSRGRLTKATDKVHIQQFNKPIGLYLENIGQVDVIAMEWNLIIRCKMSNYWEEINQINLIYKELKEACNSTSGINCALILHQLDWQLRVIQKNNEFLMSSNKERLRQKRGIGDTMGILLGDMFGILSQREADQYENHFETIDKNEQHLLDLLSNQTSVIDNTIKLFKHNTNLTMLSLNNFKENQNRLQAEIDLLKEYASVEEKIRAIFTTTIEIMLILNNIKETQESLLDLVHNAQQNVLHPTLLTPSQLEQELSKIRKHLPPSITVLNDNSADNLEHIFNTMTLKTRITRDNLIIRVNIPLIYSWSYTLFSVIPFPNIYYNEYQAFIETSATYIAVDKQREHFASISKEKLSDCQEVKFKHFLCQLSQIYNAASKEHACEMAILRHATNLQGICNIKTINATNHWIKLHATNQWLFIVVEETHKDVICGSSIITTWFSGSGILTLDDGCMLRDSSQYLIAADKVDSEIKGQINVPVSIRQHNLSKIISTQNWQTTNNSNLNHVKQEDYINLTMDTSKLDHDIKVLKENQFIYERNNTHHVHHYVLIHILFWSCTIVACATLIKYCKNKYKTRHQRQIESLPESTPIPVPRTSRGAQDV